LVKGFGEARSEDEEPRLEAPCRERGWGFCGGSAILITTGWVVLGSAVSSPCSGFHGGAPAAKGFSHILNTQDDLSGQQDYGPCTRKTYNAQK